MSQQALDLRTSMHLVRRHKYLVAIVMLLAMAGSGGYAKVHPPMLTSTALVVLPQSAAQGAAAANANGSPDPFTATQEVVAGSNEVLAGAVPGIAPPVSIDTLRHEIQIGSLTPYVISITAKNKVAVNAEAAANAVAKSYIHYIGSANSPVGRVTAQLLEPATSAAGPTAVKQLIIYVLLGAVAGGVIGVVIALAIGRRDRRLRERDEIADSIGVPVLVSVPAQSPRDAAGWTKPLTRGACTRPCTSWGSSASIRRTPGQPAAPRSRCCRCLRTGTLSPSARSWLSSPRPWASGRLSSSVRSRTRMPRRCSGPRAPRRRRRSAHGICTSSSSTKVTPVLCRTPR
jgi:capsular polysaccharide biosynthesis protein